MKKISVLVIVLVVVGLLSSGVSAQSDENEGIAKAVIAMAKAQWAWENANPGKSYDKDIADDYTEFNQAFPVRMEGKAMASKAYEAMTQVGDKGMMSDMTNVKVQVYNGDTAILTYNYVGVTKDADGKTTANLAKSTRIYVKMGNTWKLVHANFAPVTVPDN